MVTIVWKSVTTAWRSILLCSRLVPFWLATKLSGFAKSLLASSWLALLIRLSYTAVTDFWCKKIVLGDFFSASSTDFSSSIQIKCLICFFNIKEGHSVFGTLCPLGRFVLLDILSMGHFVLRDVLSLGRGSFLDVLSLPRLSQHVFLCFHVETRGHKAMTEGQHGHVQE